MESHLKKRVYKSSFWLLLGSYIQMLLGYSYWIFISRLSSEEVVGEGSSYALFGNIVALMSIVGVATGLQHSMGRLLKGNTALIDKYFSSGIVFLAFAPFFTGALASYLAYITGILINIRMIFSALIISILLSIQVGLNSTFIAFEKTDILSFIRVLAVVFRLVTGIILVLTGYGGYGVVLSFLFAALFADLVLWFKLWKDHVVQLISPAFGVLKEVIREGFPYWAPNAMVSISLQVSQLMVYGFKGAASAGLYYVAFSIANMLNLIPTTILTSSIPILSGSKSDVRKVISSVITISSCLLYPISVSSIFYPKLFLSFFGGQYLASELTLRILMVSTVFQPYISAAYALHYAKDSYKEVFKVGLAGSIPTLILYYYTVGELGETGAATSIVLGSLSCFLYSIYSTWKKGFKYSAKKVAIELGFPTVYSLILLALGIPYYIGMPLSAFLSYLTYFKLKLISKREIIEALKD